MLSSCTSILSEKAAENHTQPTKKQSSDAGETKEKLKKHLLIRELTIEKVFELHQSGSILLLDTRPPIFYRLGHIEGAHSLPLKKFDESFENSKRTLDAAASAGKEIVIYCQSENCSDSGVMAQALSKSGYNVSIFKGGWELWNMSGL